MSEYSYEAVPCGHQYDPVLRRIFHIQTQQYNAGLYGKLHLELYLKKQKAKIKSEIGRASCRERV